MSGQTFALGTCWLCGQAFTFDPDLVPSVFIDPKTSRPADVDDDGRFVEPDADAVERSRREPLCSTCVEFVNHARARHGRAKIEILPGAYR